MNPALPAIDAAGSPFSATDQRGRTRPFGAGADIGAFESSPPYAIRGSIYGYNITPGLTVAAGPASASTDANLRYALFGLGMGTVTVIPTDTNYVHIPADRNVNVIADTLGIDCKAYRKNALSIESHSWTNHMLHLIFAGAPGQTHHVEASPDLRAWTIQSTNLVEANGLFSIFHSTSPGTGPLYFRVLTP